MTISLEKIREKPHFTWWADSGEIPGFSASAKSVPRLFRLVGMAVPEILSETERRSKGVRTFTHLGLHTDESADVSPAAFEPSP